MALHRSGAQASDQDRYWSDRDLPEHTGFRYECLSEHEIIIVIILKDWNDCKGTDFVI